MKFCPYCGTKLNDNKSIFCAECGKVLSSSQQETVSTKKGKSLGKKKVRKKTGTYSEQCPVPVPEKTDDGYDGYYDDILPNDDGDIRQSLDKAVIKKVALLIVGLLIVVGICIALMYLM